MSMMQAVLFLSVVLWGCSESGVRQNSGQKNQPEQRDSSNADQNDALLLVTILQNLQISGDTVHNVVVQRETAPPEEVAGETPRERLADIHRRLLPDLQHSTERSFWERNVAPETLQSAMIPGIENWISEEDFRTRVVDTSAGWEDFFRQYPGSDGLISFSRPGYSHDGTQALIYVSIACPLCGRGEYLLLSRTSGRWKIVARSVDWLS